jgi:hypothetical protein
MSTFDAACHWLSYKRLRLLNKILYGLRLEVHRCSFTNCRVVICHINRRNKRSSLFMARMALALQGFPLLTE